MTRAAQIFPSSSSAHRTRRPTHRQATSAARVDRVPHWLKPARPCCWRDCGWGCFRRKGRASTCFCRRRIPCADEWMTAREALELATLGGARVLGRSDIGSLAPVRGDAQSMRLSAWQTRHDESARLFGQVAAWSLQRRGRAWLQRQRDESWRFASLLQGSPTPPDRRFTLSPSGPTLQTEIGGRRFE